jgi:hypothetical protein
MTGPTETAREAARRFADRGWRPVPLRSKDKRPVATEWNQLFIGPDEIDRHFAETANVGLLLGEPSGGLVDVDLDCFEAIEAATDFLPGTGMTWGRASRPRSHRDYIADPCPANVSFKDPTDGTALVELHSTNRQTMVPPSVHPDGEVLEMIGDGQPARVDGQELVRQVHLLAVTTLLARHWPGRGSRHDMSLALAGGLLRAGIDDYDAERIIRSAAALADDEEIDDRIASIWHTRSKIDADERVQGWPTLEGYIDERICRTVRKWLGLKEQLVDDERPQLCAAEGDLDALTSKAWKAVVAANDPAVLFRRGGLCVRVERDEDDRPMLRALNEDRVIYRLAEVIAWHRAKDHAPAHPPRSVAKNMLADDGPPLPAISRIVAAPVFAASGRLQGEVGYNPEARIYYWPQKDFELPSVPDSPSPEDVDRARELLFELVIDFPFVSEAERAHAIAALLLPFGRDLIDGPTPLHLVESPAPGTGKGRLVEVLTIPALPGGATVMPEPGDEDEMRKRILATLLGGAPIVLLDNLGRALTSSTLAAVLTSRTWEDRVLGVSENARVPNTAVWFATANNPVVSNEIARRTVRIRIDARQDRPHLRAGFRHELPAWAIEHRPELVWAALVLWQAWLSADRPSWRGKTLGSFESWTRTMGAVLEIAGVTGFLDNAEALVEEADLEGAAWRAFVNAWWERYRTTPKKAGDLLRLADDAGIYLRSSNEQGRKVALGKKLAQQRNRFFGDLEIRGEQDRTGAMEWRLVPRPGSSPDPGSGTPEPSRQLAPQLGGAADADDPDLAELRRAAEELRNGPAQALVAVTSESGSEPPSGAGSAGDAGDPGPALRTDTLDPTSVGPMVHPPHSPASSAHPKPAVPLETERTEAQEEALDAISSWLDQGGDQVFRLFGYAGTGKTTLAREIARRYPPGQVLLAAYTGKASLVLARTCSAPASTIHRLIYVPTEVTETVDGRRRIRTEWRLRDDSPLRRARMLIVDEVSMVDDQMGQDLLSFGTKVLVLGDPFQLPPVSDDKEFFTSAEPDAMLTEVHRHKGDGGRILDLATAIRTGDPWQAHPGVRTDEPDVEELVDYDAVICGTHRTRMDLNNRIRRSLGFALEDGPQPGEKVICDRNDTSAGLLNGQTCTVVSAEAQLDRLGRVAHYLMALEDDEGQTVTVVSPVEDFTARSCRNPRGHRGMGCLMYAYAITCHKAQGSQWGSVLVIDESSTFRENQARWLYTAVTRAVTEVTVVRYPVATGPFPDGYWD